MSSTQRRTGSTTTVAAKRLAPSSSENAGCGGKIGVGGAAEPHAAKKRPPLSNVTNQRRGSLGTNPTMVPCVSAQTVKPKKGPSTSFGSKITSLSGNGRSNNVLATQKPSVPKTKSDENVPPASTPAIAPPNSAACSMDISPSPSSGFSISMDESMSTCDSLKSPEVEYLDENNIAVLDSIERKTCNNLHISEQIGTTGNVCKRDILAETEIFENVVNVDDNLSDPQLCATFACDIYKHLRASEMKKRPSTTYMEKIQQDINASMRSILIDWLVEVSEEYRLVPDTFYLTVNYIDRYLSGNSVNRQRLQLLGVSCMMIAAKYEEICAPQVEEFCYITDNTYFKEEVLQMESSVLNFLKFEMTAPTTKCFLRRFVRVAQVSNEAPALQLECLANYVAELSLLEYNMLQYAPSLTAASSIFLARFILNPSKRPWNATLKHYTLYEASDLIDCVQAVHRLCLDSHSSSLPAIREKYSQHKYKYVAKKHCPASVPPEYFDNTSSL